MNEVAAARTSRLNDGAIHTGGRYVLYWMLAQRRTGWSHALDRAAAWARHLDRPLLIFEPLRLGYPWASARLHRFVLDGMADNAEACAAHGVTYFPYVEPAAGAGRGLLRALAAEAAAVVTDDYPAFTIPRMVSAAVSQVPVWFERVDGNGLLPMRLAGQAFSTAYAFRRYVQRTLPAHVPDAPAPDPLAALPKAQATVPPAVLARWPAADPDLLAGRSSLDALPLDRHVVPTAQHGGARAARDTLVRFLEAGLHAYGRGGRHAIEHDAGSRLSAYLHFGHIGSHEVFARLMRHEGWLGQLPSKSNGARAGWWGVSPGAEAYLDQLVTWRELGFNMCAHRSDYDQYESLPHWARATLDAHTADRREHCYPLAAFESALTHDALWNAAQRQLVRDGRIHSYLRMLWGKKVLEWTATPREALAVLIELNNKYALDGRDPNSYSGIFWTLGRYDRPWAPERPVFGTVRYMSSANTARKMSVKGYLREYGAAADEQQPSLFAG